MKVEVHTVSCPRVPSFGSACVCCDAPDAPDVELRPTLGRGLGDPIAVPICAACAPHVARRPYLAVRIVGALVTFAVLAVIAALAGYRSIPVVGGLVAAGLGAASWAWVARARHDAAARAGHHRDLFLGAGPGFVVVQTTNPRLAARLREAAATGPRP